MCTRRTEDPLVRTFLDRYKLNLLLIPREDADCGDLYVEDDHGLSTSGSVNHVLDPPVMLPSLVVGEKLTDIEGLISLRVEVGFGLGLLENFLVMTGASGIIDSLKASYKKNNAQHVKFRFRNATRDYVDPLELGSALKYSHLDPDHPFVQKGNRYYLVTGVVRTHSMSIYAEDNRSKAVDVDLDILHAAEAKTSVSAGRSETGEITYYGTKHLAIGVELYEIIYTEETQKLCLKSQRKTLRLRSKSSRPMISPALIGGDEGDIFIKVN